MSDKVIYIIPAREGSKGLPHKNRKLIYYATQSLRGRWMDTYITTDDQHIREMYYNTLINIIDRPKVLAADDTSMKDVLMHAVSEIKPSDDTLLVTLYPTYPERTAFHIDAAIKFFEENNGKSMLCRKHYKGLSPYLMMFPVIDWEGGMRGKQVIPHNLYRRQDYSPVFEISHYIAITKVDELSNLNSNLYNSQTLFYPITDVIDVDTPEDLNKFKAIQA